jgi:hypothetical protein
MLGLKDAPADRRTSDYASNIQYGAMCLRLRARFSSDARPDGSTRPFFGGLAEVLRFCFNRSHLAKDHKMLGLQLSFVRQAAPGKMGEFRDRVFARWFRGTHGDRGIPLGGRRPRDSPHTWLGPGIGRHVRCSGRSGVESYVLEAPSSTCYSGRIFLFCAGGRSSVNGQRRGR